MYLVGIIESNDNKIKMNQINKKKLFNICKINENNILNYKNVMFNALIINQINPRLITKKEMERVIKNSKILILNIDNPENRKVIQEVNEIEVITYGFSKRATVTIVSCEEGNIILDFQRKIIGLNNNIIEEKEISEKCDEGRKRNTLFYKHQNFGKFIVII